MKRTDRLTVFIALVCFLAVAAYLGAYVIAALTDSTVTAEATAATVSVGGTASGIVVRAETLLESDEPYIDVALSDGAKVAANGTVATAMRNANGLQRANRIDELELEISRISALLGEESASTDLTTRDANLKSALLSLTAAVARADFDSADSAAAALGSYVLSNAGTYSSEDLADLESELNSLKTSSSSDTLTLTAPAAGVFTTYTDGYEVLTPDDLDGLTVEGVRALLDTEPGTPENVYGKLVTDTYWYFACVLSEQDAQGLSGLTSVTLDFGKYYSSPIQAKIVSVSAVSDGDVAVVFRCSTALSETLVMRVCSAEVIFSEFEGLRVPAGAVNSETDVNGDIRYYVWTVTAMQLEKKTVTVLYEGDGFTIVAREASADALRDGNTVVVSGKDLYEGKLMN